MWISKKLSSLISKFNLNSIAKTQIKAQTCHDHKDFSRIASVRSEKSVKKSCEEKNENQLKEREKMKKSRVI